MISARSSTKAPALPLVLLFVATAGVILFKYSELPFTKHATESHASENWNASSITDYFDSGKCTPTEYACPSADFKIAYCEMENDKSIGLVIGLATRRIITGFMADTTYWQNRCP